MGRAASGGEFWGVCELSMTFCKASILQLKKGKKSPEPGVWNNHSRDILNIFQTFKNVFMNVLHLCGSLCCCSVTQSCLTLWDPMDCSTPGFPVLDCLPDWCSLSWWCHPTISSSVVPFSSHLQSFPASGSFPVSWLFASGSQSIGASASTSVLPVNIQDWFPLRLMRWISLKFKGLSRVFSNATVQKH